MSIDSQNFLTMIDRWDFVKEYLEHEMDFQILSGSHAK